MRVQTHVRFRIAYDSMSVSLYEFVWFCPWSWWKFAQGKARTALPLWQKPFWAWKPGSTSASAGWWAENRSHIGERSYGWHKFSRCAANRMNDRLLWVVCKMKHLHLQVVCAYRCSVSPTCIHNVMWIFVGDRHPRQRRTEINGAQKSDAAAVRKWSKRFNRQASRGLCSLQMLKHDREQIWRDVNRHRLCSRVDIKWIYWRIYWQIYWRIMDEFGMSWLSCWCFCYFLLISWVVSHVPMGPQVFGGHHHGRGCRPFAQSPWVSWPKQTADFRYLKRSKKNAEIFRIKLKRSRSCRNRQNKTQDSR